MYQAVLGVFLAFCILVILIVAIQPSKTNAASSLSGGAEQLFGKQKARGFEAFLIRATATLGTIFMVLALVLAYLSSK